MYNRQILIWILQEKRLILSFGLKKGTMGSEDTYYIGRFFELEMINQL